MRISKIKSLTVRWITPLTGGLIFLVIFHYGYSTIDPDYYTLRDDGIITLSHARNLVDYGFIGVGPSGEKVEGYSAPVQFFVYALAYFTLNLGFSNYTKAQVLFCTFALGFIFTRFFEDKKCFALITTTITAFLLTRQTSFIQWHASGMENSITHILFALTAYILFKFSQNKNINLNAVIIPFLASISRIDGIYHIFPLLLIFCVYWAIFEKSNKGIVFLLLSTLLWVAYNTWRYYYFGTLSPNTAYAQDISIGEQLAALIILVEEFLNSSIELSTFIFSAHGAYFIFLALPFVVFAGWKRSYGLLFVISLSIIIIGWFNPFVFGVTRLDVTRSTTQVAFFVFTAISCVFYSVKTYKALILIPLLFPIGIFIHRSSYVAPYYMCCSIGGFDSIRQEFAKEADRQNLARPTVSNPDLGVMSWHKQFNIIDMGMLGSQIMVKLKNGPVLANYFFDFAAPDMIESHESWSCRYFESIFSDRRFREMYVPVREKSIRWEPCGEKELPIGIWVRKDILRTSSSLERKLIDDLAKDLSVDRVKKELADCQSIVSVASGCAYVSRTAFRFLPEFRNVGSFEQLVDVFKLSRTMDFDLFLLTGFKDGRAHEKAILSIYEDFLNDSDFLRIKGGNGFKIYVNDSFVVYSNYTCLRSDILPSFYLHVIPIYPETMKLNDSGFLNLDFNFRSFGFKIENTCVAIRDMPKKKIKAIRTGQWIPSQGFQIWETKFELNGPKHQF